MKLRLIVCSLYGILLGSIGGNANTVPDYQWEPEPFRYEAGESQRYIDFENGDDGNPGSKNAPWKHHPWDPQASGNAAAREGIHTYVFKKGVAYRGQLIADDSGVAGNPIRLTVDPNWGEGEAEILGSEKVSGTWKRYSGSEGLPFPEVSAGKIWTIDLDIDYDPKLLWMIDGEDIVRVPVAREPDWQISNPDDPRSEWWEWTAHHYYGVVSVESTDKFSVGDKIWTIETNADATIDYVQLFTMCNHL